jgi:vacuolar-type H+-ATPase subunit H
MGGGVLRTLLVTFMGNKPDRRADRHPVGDGVAEAMNRVLAAERAALAEIEACREEAEKTLEAARREARAILERAERVARDIHARTGPHAEARARRLRERWAREHEPADPGDVLSGALQRLASRMTGSGDA